MKHIAEVAEGQVIRLSEYLPGVFPVLTTNKGIKKAIKRGLLLVNGKASSTGRHVRTGDELVYLAPKPILLDLPTIKIEVPYEDEHIAVVNKPSGLTSSGNVKISLANYLPHVISVSNKVDALPVPLLAHRLDKATSGLLLVGKTSSSIIALGRLLSDRKVKKSYVAICEGKVAKTLKRIDEPIDGQAAVTIVEECKILTTRDQTSLVYLTLETGRTHQIRRHLAMVGNPIIGDPIYNKDGLSFGRGLFLAAIELAFEHPITKEPITCEIPLPSKFQKYLSVES